MIAAIRLTEAQLDLARREVARRRPGVELAEGLVAIAAQQLAAERPAPRPAPAAVAPVLPHARVDVEISPGEGVGVVVRSGECVRVQQVGDGQGADLVAYDAADTRIRFSAARSRLLGGTRPTVGCHLWSGAPCEAPLLTIVADSCPSHDLTFPACSRFEYEHHAGLADHANCFDVQAAVVRAWDLEPDDVPDPLNLWLPTSVDAAGRLRSEPTTASAGDHIDLLARRDVLVVVTPCPDDVFGTSCWDPKPIRVLVAATAEAADADPGLHVARAFPPPTITELEVDVPADLVARLGPDAPAALRGLFFRAWLP
jgi:uncharacterized protein